MKSPIEMLAARNRPARTQPGGRTGRSTTTTTTTTTSFLVLASVLGCGGLCWKPLPVRSFFFLFFSFRFVISFLHLSFFLLLLLLFFLFLSDSYWNATQFTTRPCSPCVCVCVCVPLFLRCLGFAFLAFLLRVNDAFRFFGTLFQVVPESSRCVAAPSTAVAGSITREIKKNRRFFFRSFSFFFGFCLCGPSASSGERSAVDVDVMDGPCRCHFDHESAALIRFNGGDKNSRPPATVDEDEHKKKIEKKMTKSKREGRRRRRRRRQKKK